MSRIEGNTSVVAGTEMKAVLSHSALTSLLLDVACAEDIKERLSIATRHRG